MVGVERGQTEGMGRLGEGDRLGPLLRDPRRLGDAGVDVPEGHENERDLTSGVGRAPLIDHPVVVGGNAGGGELLVGRVEERAAGEARETGEAQLGVDSVDIHVLHPLSGVEAARQHVGVLRRVEPELLTLLAGDRVEPDVVLAAALEQPHVVAVLVGDVLGTGFLELGGQSVLPDVGVLDDVVVDADDLGVLGQRHLGGSFPSVDNRPVVIIQARPRCTVRTAT